jgi:hypothetical protein
MKGQSEPELDDEDHILLDPEATPVYENETPRIVTVEGFGLNYRDAETVFGRI